MVVSPGFGAIEALSSSELREYLQNEFQSLGEEEVTKDIESFICNMKNVLEGGDDCVKKKEVLLSLSNTIIKKQ